MIYALIARFGGLWYNAMEEMFKQGSFLGRRKQVVVPGESSINKSNTKSLVI